MAGEPEASRIGTDDHGYTEVIDLRNGGAPLALREVRRPHPELPMLGDHRSVGVNQDLRVEHPIALPLCKAEGHIDVELLCETGDIVCRRAGDSLRDPTVIGDRLRSRLTVEPSEDRLTEVNETNIWIVRFGPPNEAEKMGTADNGIFVGRHRHGREAQRSARGGAWSPSHRWHG